MIIELYCTEYQALATQTVLLQYCGSNNSVNKSVFNCVGSTSHLWFWMKFPFITFSLKAVPDTSLCAPLLSLFFLTAQTQSWHAPEINLRATMLVTALFHRVALLHLAWIKLCFAFLPFCFGSWAGQSGFVTWPCCALKSLRECTSECTSQLQQCCLHKGPSTQQAQIEINWNCNLWKAILGLQYTISSPLDETIKLLPR